MNFEVGSTISDSEWQSITPHAHPAQVKTNSEFWTVEKAMGNCKMIFPKKVLQFTNDKRLNPVEIYDLEEIWHYKIKWSLIMSLIIFYLLLLYEKQRSFLDETYFLKNLSRWKRILKYTYLFVCTKCRKRIISKENGGR